MNSQKQKPHEGASAAKDDPKAVVAQPDVEESIRFPEILRDSVSVPHRDVGETPRGRNERLLKSIADLIGVPESNLQPGAEPFGPGSQLGELNELVQTFLTIEDADERRRILDAVRQAARTKSRS